MADALAAGGINVSATVTAAHTSSDVAWTALLRAIGAATELLSANELQKKLRDYYLHRMGALRNKLSGHQSLRKRVKLYIGAGAGQTWISVMATLQNNDTPQVTPFASNMQLLAMFTHLESVSGSNCISFNQLYSKLVLTQYSLNI